MEYLERVVDDYQHRYAGLKPSGELSLHVDRHGIIAVGRDALTTFEHVERLEHICKIALVSGKTPN